MDHVVVIDDVDAVSVATSTGPGVGDDESAAEKRLKAVIIKMRAMLEFG
jgi:hypothetical protein